MKNVANDAAKEIPEEVLTTVLQDLCSKYESVSPDASKIIQNKLASALNAFRQKPSSKNYAAAVDAGLPPIGIPNRKERSKYADTLNQPVQIPGTPTPTDATGSAPEVAQSPMALTSADQAESDPICITVMPSELWFAESKSSGVERTKIVTTQ